MDTFNNILNNILILAIVQGFIFNGIIHFKNKPRNTAIFYLNLTIFFFTLSNLQSYFLKKGMFNDYPFLNYTFIDVSWNIFIAPLFFLFLIYYLKIDQHYRNILKYSVIVFVGLIIARFLLLIIFKNDFHTLKFDSMLRRYNIWEDIFVLFTTVAVYTYCIYLFFKLKNRFKYITSFNDLKWLKTFFIFTLIVLVLWMIAIFLDYHYTNIKTANIYTPLRFVTSILIYWLGYQGYNQYLLTRDRISLRSALEEDDSINNVVETNVESFSEVEFLLFQKIKKIIHSQKLFLDPLLSLESLAAKMDVSKSSISKIINTYSEQNFTNFINTFRVNYAKKILLDPNYTIYTIASIGLESGFNSKSTFYTAFKKFLGKTPAEFRKTQNT